MVCLLAVPFSLSFSGDVQISPFRGVFERYYLLPGDKPDTYRVQAVGLSNEEKKYIIMTANNNIRLSTTGSDCTRCDSLSSPRRLLFAEERLGDDALWCFESRAAERAKDKDGEWIAMRSYTSAHYLGTLIARLNRMRCASHFVGVVANAVRAIPSYSCDSCLLLHRKQMMTYLLNYYYYYYYEILLLLFAGDWTLLRANSCLLLATNRKLIYERWPTGLAMLKAKLWIILSGEWCNPIRLIKSFIFLLTR